MSLQAGIGERYDANAHRYEDAAALNRMAARRLVDAVPDGVYPRLLDVGCGTGFATLEAIDRRGVREVVGLDVSAGMIDALRAKLAARPDVRADLRVGDIATARFAPDSADLAICCMALHWFDDRAGAIATMAGALAPGGVLALVAPGPGHDREYADLLRGLRPPVPDPVWQVFGRAAVHPEPVREAIEAAGLVVDDLWVEQRRRRVPVAHYMARITAVGSHVWSRLMGPEEQADMLRRIEQALHAVSGPHGWEYTFTKTFAVASRPVRS